MHLGRSMRAASIGTPPEVPTEVLKWSRPVWNSGGVPGTEADQSGAVEESQRQHSPAAANTGEVHAKYIHEDMYKLKLN